jgi:glycosyltransferase involved in cell wall biosynthesis
MNILSLGTSDQGGAGIVTKYTADLFLKFGHQSLLVVKESDLKNDNVIVLKKPIKQNSLLFYINKIKEKSERIYRRFNPINLETKYFFYNLNETKTLFSAKEILKHVPFKPDVILIFWVSGFVNSKIIRELFEKTGAKMFWLMTDNAPITGGCHYPWNCRGFHTDCSECPALIDPSKKHIARKILAFKKKYLPENLELIAGSESDYKRARKSSLFTDKKIHKLVAPIDENRFMPGDKIIARKHFGVDSRKRVIFYGSDSLEDPRKGGQYFLKALDIFKEKIIENNLNQDDFLILVASKGDNNYFRNNDISRKHLGYLNEDNLIRAYQAADIFVCPSVEDSGPLMVNQSIICGTPVVSFDTGVSTELVHTGKTGYRANLFDTGDLAAGIYSVLTLSGDEYQKMSSNCRTLALNTFSINAYYEKIMKIFQGRE